MDAREKRNRRVGILTSVGVHAVVFLILFFVIAWRAPDPPLPEYGIELNFGLDDQGTGDVQPEEPAGDRGDSETEENAQTEKQEESSPAEETDESATAQTEEPVVSKAESPVTVKEEPKTTASKETTKPETKEQSKESMEKLTETKPKDAAAKDVTEKGDATSHGDDARKTGDKGSEEGKLDAKALYGTPGGGGGGAGMNLQMSGWAWAEEPTIPQLPDNEDGRIVFEIECDENGDITGITSLERTLSPRAEQLLKDMIRKNSLVRTSGGMVPERSKGKIVFVLRTK